MSLRHYVPIGLLYRSQGYLFAANASDAGFSGSVHRMMTSIMGTLFLISDCVTVQCITSLLLL